MPAEIKINNQTTPPTNWTRDLTSGYQGDHLHRDPGPASEYAEWSFSGLSTSKTYAVFASWVVKNDTSTPPLPLNASDARYEVHESGALKATFFANQKYEPADEITDTNIKWSRIGFYKPGATSLTIRLPADANGKLVADGLRLVELGPLERTVYNKVGNPVISVDALGNETIRRYDDLNRLISVVEPLRDPTITPWRPAPVDNQKPPNVPYLWNHYTDNRAYNDDYLGFIAGDGAQHVKYVLGLPGNPQNRTFAVMATWTPNGTLINPAGVYATTPSGGYLGSFYLDQKFEPNDYQDENGHWWEIVGVFYNLPPAVANLWVTPVPGTQADAVRIVEVGNYTRFSHDKVGNLTQVTRSGYFDSIPRGTLSHPTLNLKH